FLNRRLSHTGHRMFVLHDRRRAPDDAHPGGVDDFQERVNERPPGTVGFGTGHAATPAVHSTVALGILFPPAITPLSSTVSTLTFVTTFTPSFSRRLATLCESDSAKVGRTRLPASSRMILAFAGSMRWKLPRSVTFTRCAKDPASSTPVGPAPTSTNVICRARSASSSVVAASSNAPRILAR